MELKQNTGVAQNLTESESLMNILYLVPHKTFLLQVAFGVLADYLVENWTELHNFNYIGMVSQLDF